jgi:hypothetical protein
MARKKQDTVSQTTVDKTTAVGVHTLDELDEQLAAQLVEHARAQGTGPCWSARTVCWAG